MVHLCVIHNILFLGIEDLPKEMLKPGEVIVLVKGVIYKRYTPFSLERRPLQLGKGLTGMGEKPGTNHKSVKSRLPFIQNV